MDINKIKEISLDYFSKTDIGAELKSILEAYERIQEAAALFADHDNEKRLVKIRIGTILTFGTASRILKGKWPKDYSKDDWIDLVNMVSEYAVKVDDQNYSVFIFKLYADYIDASITMLAGNVSEDTLNPIKCLAEELRKKSDLFEDNGIGESEYTEECLWICLDAMIKLLSATVTKYAGEELGHFTEGLASVAFEYGRLMLYRKEQELLKQYIENQHGEPFIVRAAVPGTDGEAGRGIYRRAFACDIDRPEDHQQEPALDSRDGDRDI